MNTIVFSSNSNLNNRLKGLDSYLENWRSKILNSNILGILEIQKKMYICMI